MKQIQSIPYPEYTQAERDALVDVLDGFIIKNTTAGANQIYTDSEWKGYNSAPLAYSITKEPTGFVNPELVNVSYNSTNRTITLTGDLTAYWRGEQITALNTTWTSDAHSATVANYFLYYNGTSFVWSTSIWTFDMVQIAIVIQNTFAMKETHGLMDWQTHREFHETQGTYRTSGGDFSSYVLNSTTSANRRPDISATYLKDEDCTTTLPSLTSKLYTRRFLSSTDTVNYTIGASDIISLSTNQPYYNLFTGGAWTQQLMTNNSYAAIFVLAVPVTSDTGSQSYRYQFIQPQTESATLATIKSLTAASVNLGNPSAIGPEYIITEKIIIRYTAGNWILISSEKLAGTSSNSIVLTGGFLSAVTTSGLALAGNGTATNPLNVLQRDGFFDYNHDGTTQSYTAPNAAIVLNNGAGPWTTDAFKPLGVTDLYDIANNEFTFAQLSVGDELTLRVDMNLITSVNGTVANLSLYFENGGNNFEIPMLTSAYFKTAGTYQLTAEKSFYLGSETIKNDIVQLNFKADANCTIGLNGYYITVKRRNV